MRRIKQRYDEYGYDGLFDSGAASAGHAAARGGSRFRHVPKFRSDRPRASGE